MRRTREAEIARRTHATDGHVTFEKLPMRDQIYSFRCTTCDAVVHVTDRAMEAAVVGAGIGKILEDGDPR